MSLRAINFSVRELRMAASSSDRAVGTVGRLSSRLTSFNAACGTGTLYAAHAAAAEFRSGEASVACAILRGHAYVSCPAHRPNGVCHLGDKRSGAESRIEHQNTDRIPGYGHSAARPGTLGVCRRDCGQWHTLPG